MIQVFFRLYKSKMMQNRHYGVVVQLVNFLLGSLAAYHAEGRADVRNGKSRPLHIFKKKPESNDTVFFSFVENDNNRAGYYPSSRKGGTSYP